MAADVKGMKEKARAAHEAVADLEEPFKTEAFKIFLAQFLNEGSSEKARAPVGVDRSRALPKEKIAATKKRAKRTALTESVLRLDVAGLKRLGEYCAGFVLQGTEQIAFVLANFAREHTELEFVTDGDIAYLHRQLISQRIKVAPVNNPADWTRALGWLTVPSRRKEWLEKRGTGYIVSNSGLLHWHQLEEEAKVRAQGDSLKVR